MIVTVQKINGTEFFCPWGCKRFFAQYKMDFKDFMANGIEAERLLRECDNDAQAVKIVKWCKGELYSKKLKKFYKEG